MAYDEFTNKYLFFYDRPSSIFFKKLSRDHIFEVGQVLSGLVKTHKDVGTFIELGGVIGLVKRQDVDWGPVHFSEDFLKLGSVYNFQIVKIVNEELGQKLYLSRKSCLGNPYLKANHHFRNIYQSRFLRNIQLSYLNDVLNVGVNLDVNGFEMTTCPSCFKKRGLVNQNLKVDKDENEWECLDSSCNFHGKEMSLFRVDAHNLTIAVYFNSLDSEQIQELLSLNAGDLVDIQINHAINDSVYVTGMPIKDSTLRVISKSESCIDSDFTQEMRLELARIYEDLSCFKYKSDEELALLYWSHHFYSVARHAKSYFYNIYITYIEIVSILENRTILVQSENISEVVSEVKSKAINYFKENEDYHKSIEVYDLLKNHITILQTLANLGTQDRSYNESLITILYSKPNINNTTCKLAKVILCFNLLFFDEVVANDELINWLQKIYTVLKDGLIEFKIMSFEINDIIDVESKKKKEDLLFKIQSGEGKNIEFKSSLWSPVYDEKRIKEIAKVQSQLDFAITSRQEKEIEILSKNLEGLKGKSKDSKLIFAAMKEIAAFANTQGGTLIIGVDDTKKIIGLESDFKVLKKENKQDDFKLYFDDIIKEYLGESTFDLIDTYFVPIEDKVVFVVNIKSNQVFSDPVWLLRDEKGAAASYLFLRAEGSARSLVGSDISRFISRRSQLIN